MTKDEALKLALEALQKIYIAPEHEEYIRVWWPACEQAITAIKEALAQPEPWEKFCDSNCVWTDHHPDCKLAEQEPVAWMFQHEETGRMMFVEAQQLEWGFEKGNPRLKKIRPVYTTPPQRKPEQEPVALVYDPITESITPLQRTWVGLTDEDWNRSKHNYDFQKGVDWAEAMLKEKNT